MDAQLEEVYLHWHVIWADVLSLMTASFHAGASAEVKPEKKEGGKEGEGAKEEEEEGGEEGEDAEEEEEEEEDTSEAAWEMFEMARTLFLEVSIWL